MRRYANKSYWAFTQNCTNAAADALQAGGVHFDDKMVPNKAYDANKNNGDTSGAWPPDDFKMEGGAGGDF